MAAVNEKNAEISGQNQIISRLRDTINELRTEEDKLTKQVRTAKRQRHMKL